MLEDFPNSTSNISDVLQSQIQPTPWSANFLSRSRNIARKQINPLTPKSAQLQISPAASPAILHHTVWRTWFFTPYSGGKWFRYQILTTSLIHLSLTGWENALFELGSERVKNRTPCYTAGSHKGVTSMLSGIPLCFRSSSLRQRAPRPHRSCWSC